MRELALIPIVVTFICGWIIMIKNVVSHGEDGPLIAGLLMVVVSWLVFALIKPKGV